MSERNKDYEMRFDLARLPQAFFSKARLKDGEVVDAVVIPITGDGSIVHNKAEQKAYLHMCAIARRNNHNSVDTHYLQRKGVYGENFRDINAFPILGHMRERVLFDVPDKTTEEIYEQV